MTPFVLTTSVLAAIFISYGSARFLTDAAAGVLPVATVIGIVLVKTLIALEVLFPVALYLAVVVALGRLYADNEISVLAACGVSEQRLAWTVLKFALWFALFIALFSALVRPWAYSARFALQARAEANFNVSDLEPGRFYVSPKKDYILFAESVDRDEGKARGVFFKVKRKNRLQVIRADELEQPRVETGRPVALVFHRGSAYDLDSVGSRDLDLKFDRLQINLPGPEEYIAGYRSKTQSLAALAKSAEPDDIAEFQWRLSTPLSALLLALLAVPLSRMKPRKGRYGKTVIAILSFAVFYNLTTLAKKWVEEQVLGPIPGLWWPHLLIATLVAALFIGPALGRRWRAL